MKVHTQQKVKRREDAEEEDFLDSSSEEDSDEEVMRADPFDFECRSPKECGAMSSSLWEIKSLVNHFEYKTSGHCFQTVQHFRDSKYTETVKRVEMNRCHMFEYKKLLNYYQGRNEMMMKQMKKDKKRSEKKKKL